MQVLFWVRLIDATSTKGKEDQIPFTYGKDYPVLYIFNDLQNEPDSISFLIPDNKGFFRWFPVTKCKFVDKDKGVSVDP